MAKPMIVAKNITKKFGNKVALDDVSFKIYEGQIFGFLGPSGSGKTTMINILTGQMDFDKGNTELLEKESSHIAPSDLEKIGIVSDRSGYFEKLTLEKNLQFYGKLYGVHKDEIDNLLKKVGLFESKSTIADELSTGMKQRMHLARALINKPKILFLDEPTSGLDPTTSKTIHELLLNLKEGGTTIFLTTHDMAEATLLCDNLALLNNGKLIEQGSPSDIIQKYNQDKKIKITYANYDYEIILFEEVRKIDMNKVITIHSCEPTLEEIFIKLTGVKLDV